jgi:lysophospholipase L1-like esterase
MTETGPELPEEGSTAERPASRFQSIWIRLLLGLSVAIVLLGGLELGLRIALGPPGAPVQVYSGLEGPRDYWFEIQGDLIQATYQIRQGDQGSRIPLARTGPRIAIFGGSSVRGGSVNLVEEQEFPDLLADQLGIEVYNMGRPALDSHDLVAILEEFKEVEMDAWVVYTGHNDFGNTYFHQRYAGWAGGALARLQGLLERLQIYWQLRNVVGAAKINTTDPNPMDQFSDSGVSEEQKERAMGHLELNLRRMAWLAREAGVELVFVVPVSHLNVPPAGQDAASEALFKEGSLVEARDADPIPIRAPTAAQELVRRVAAEEGVVLIDADAELPREEDEDYPESRLFMDHVHFTEYGHQAMAELIAPRLQELLAD